MEKLIITFVTCANEDEAHKIARGIAENKLGACVSISQVDSIFEWNGKIENQKENLLMIKTIKSKFDELEKFIRDNHSYECPEIVAIDAAAVSSDYAAWVISSVKEEKGK